MDKNTAERILEIASRCSHLADSSVEHATQGSSKEEFVTYRRRAGAIMASLFEEIMAPIYAEHSDLAPEWYRKMDEERSLKKL
ncbi:hypothetical protein [Chondromyces apiculatus]|uniref:hypothetical protein n=1 Tax=Chondromyces apiculatus TaxID=51 RepID=UPI0012DCAD5E|nr:hypothetical protein [Chondromyces apiculatus]